MVLSVETAEINTLLAPGDMLGCYRVESFLGRGGFGVTYLALDTKLDLRVAIKEYLPDSIAERTRDDTVQPKSSTESEVFSWGLSRFIKEAQTLAKFNHRSIVRVMAVFELNGTAYMVMEYERGQELKDLIHRPDVRSEFRLKQIVSPIIDGLAEVHRHGYIHRDIKPSNILIRENGTPVLLDFGSARLATGAQTQSLTALVSVGYAPLEQYNDTNDSQQGPWTDIYALGAVLYYAITGNVPVDSTLRGSAVVNGQLDPLPPLEELAPENVSVSFCRAIDWALSFRIRDRPQTMDQWRSRLLADDQLVDDGTVLMPRVSTRALEPQLAALGQHTARNQSIGTHRSKRAEQEASQRLTDESHIAQETLHFEEDEHADLDNDAYEIGHDWETTHEKEQRSGLHRSKRSRRGAETSRSRKQRTPVIIGLACILLALLAFSMNSIWLPTVQGLLSSEPDTISTQTQATSQPTIESVKQDNEANTQIEQPITQEQTIVAEAQRLDIQRAQDAAIESSRQAKLDAQNAAADAARLIKEQTIRDQEKAAQAKLEAIRVANEAAAQQREDEAAANAQRKALQEAHLAAQKANREQEIRQQTNSESKTLESKQATEAAKQEQNSNDSELLTSLDMPSQPAIDPARPITDTDIGNVLQQFNLLRQAIIDKDETVLSAMTFPAERKILYFTYLFKTYESIEISLNGVSTSRGDQTIRASLNILSMKRSNGDVIFPPSEFKTIPIYSVRTDEWSKIHWK